MQIKRDNKERFKKRQRQAFQLLTHMETYRRTCYDFYLQGEKFFFDFEKAIKFRLNEDKNTGHDLSKYIRLLEDMEKIIKNYIGWQEVHLRECQHEMQRLREIKATEDKASDLMLNASIPQTKRAKSKKAKEEPIFDFFELYE